jgi:hypothetical protein
LLVLNRLELLNFAGKCVVEAQCHIASRTSIIGGRKKTGQTVTEQRDSMEAESYDFGVVNSTASLCREPWEIATYFPSAENAQAQTFPDVK